MAAIAYPGSGDLVARLEAHGFTVSTALRALLEDAAAAGRADVERACDQTFEADSAATQRRFDPPTCYAREGATLPLGRGLAAAPTAVAYTPRGSTATPWVAGTDYELLPFNALADGEPYRELLIINGNRWSEPLSSVLRGSIYITGRWGWPALPRNVFAAMVSRGLWRHWSDLTMALTGGLLSWSEGDVKKDYGVERWSTLRDALDADYQGIQRLYRNPRALI